jgi:hypothetical protein
MTCTSVKFQTSDFILLSWLVEVAFLYHTKKYGCKQAELLAKPAWLIREKIYLSRSRALVELENQYSNSAH